MAQPRRFKNPRPDHAGIPFVIDYDVNTGTPEDPVWEPREARFTTVSQVSGGALLDFGVWSNGRVVEATALLQWFSACLPDAEAARFTALMYDKAAAIDINVLGEVAKWLSDEFASRLTRADGDGRPSSPSASLPNGSTAHGPGQTAHAPSGAST